VPAAAKQDERLAMAARSVATDTRDKIGQGEPRTATLYTASLGAAACNADPAEVATWRATSHGAVTF
jgi:hypothetical protein